MAKPTDVKILYRKGNASQVIMKVYGKKHPTDVQITTKEVSKYVVSFLVMSNPALQRFCFLADYWRQKNDSLRFW